MPTSWSRPASAISRLRAASLWLALLGLAGAACQPAPSSPASSARITTSAGADVALRGGTFTEAIAGVAGYLNPLFADEDDARDIDGLVYQGLTQVGRDQQIEPLLARSFEVSPDGMTYTIQLRTDIRWADGLPFTADDVVFTFGVLQDPAYTLPEAATWKGVAVRKVSADEVAFTLKSPSAGFLNSLRIGIIPQHLFFGQVATIPTSPYSGPKAIGTGPFMVESISPDRTVVTLRRNPYANPAPHLDRVVFRSYPSLDGAVGAVAGGQADGVGGEMTPAEVRELDRPGVTVTDLPTFSFASVFLDLDPSHPYFSDPAVRQALSEAIDRPALIRKVLGGAGDPQFTPIPAHDWAYSAQAALRFPYDPEAAARALDAAGWTVPDQGLYRTRQGVDFVVDLVVADAFPYRDVGRVVQSQLAAVGIGVRLRIVPADQLVTQYLGARSYQMALANLDNGPDPDQFAFWHSSARDYALNFSNLPQQAFIDKDLEDGRASSSMADRLAAYADLQDLLVAAAPALFLYSPHYQYAVSSRIRGVHMNPVIDAADRFQYVTDWQLG
ncbi:MAG TPA: peptide ABC transporter substrate-binding protein [Candidatus Dormibacteraeota bacterium]|nr:peptide ABC transporter substrate-binding protein [Candidatus Dormibacteraeota bacterium]